MAWYHILFVAILLSCHPKAHTPEPHPQHPPFREVEYLVEEPPRLYRLIMNTDIPNKIVTSRWYEEFVKSRERPPKLILLLEQDHRLGTEAIQIPRESLYNLLVIACTANEKYTFVSSYEEADILLTITIVDKQFEPALSLHLGLVHKLSGRALMEFEKTVRVQTITVQGNTTESMQPSSSPREVHREVQ